jgi:protein-S-isoprenylcysteine O-methyltransferase Ste14
MELRTKTLLSLPTLPLFPAVLVFLPAGTLDYWQAWVYCIVFGGICCAMLLYMLKKDPQLLQRRFESKEPTRIQAIIVVLIRMVFAAILIAAGLDHRYGWSHVPTAVAIAGQAVMLAGLLVIFEALRENTFASSIVTVEEGQKVISTGLYRWIRHPMYSGAVLMQLGTPIALGSWWVMLSLIPFIAICAWRLLDEEKLLLAALPGYKEYTEKTRYRLIPRIW